MTPLFVQVVYIRKDIDILEKVYPVVGCTPGILFLQIYEYAP